MVLVVEGTPGPGALVQFMLERVWNIEATKESRAADQLLAELISVCYSVNSVLKLF